MGTRPTAYRFSHPANNRKFVRVGTWWDGRKRCSWSKGGLEGATTLTTATHLASTNEKGEGWWSCLRRGEASFGENVSGQAC